MNIHALICSRSEDQTPTLNSLIQYLSRCGVNVKLLINQDSIFGAYDKAFNELNPNDDSIVIMCHDDIEILMDPIKFVETLVTSLSNEKVAFLGVAGSKTLDKDAVWWNQANFQAGKLRGLVFHGKSHADMMPSFYGALEGEVIAMDGLFLAAKARTIRAVDLKKPKEYKGEWDFYDLHYTAKAWNLGYINKVVPILVRHESKGESMYSRESWNLNRIAFIKNNFLPITCK